MAFYYDFKVPTLDTGSAGEMYVFGRWLTEKSYIKAGTAIAVVSAGSMSYLLRNAGEGFFTPWRITEGEKISAGQAIGRINTDGELIPYGRPYVTFEMLHDGQP